MNRRGFFAMIVGMLGAACGGRVASPQIVPTPPPDEGEWVPVQFYALKVGLNEPDTYYIWGIHVYQNGALLSTDWSDSGHRIEIPLKRGQTYEVELFELFPPHEKTWDAYEFQVTGKGQTVTLLGGI